MLNPTIFRENDIRGIADVELLDPDIEELGKAIGTYLQRRSGKNITLGRDCRLSSERLRNALIRGLKATGCHVADVGGQAVEFGNAAARPLVDIHPPLEAESHFVEFMLPELQQLLQQQPGVTCM